MTMTRRREKNKKKQSLFWVSFPLSLSLSKHPAVDDTARAFKEGSPEKERKEKWRRDLRFEMEKQAVQKQKKRGCPIGCTYLYETLKKR